MDHSKYLGTTENFINWQPLIEELSHKTAGFVGPVLPDDIDENHPDLKMWKDSGYMPYTHGGSAEWHMYYPDVDFDRTIINEFMDLFSIKTINHVWISVIHPGKCAPWHSDSYMTDVVNRIHCHIGEPETGHVFMINNEYYIDKPAGSTFLWNDPNAKHAGFNCGTRPKFLLNLY